MDFSKLILLELDEIVKIDLIVDRPLFNPPQKVNFTNKNPKQGVSTANNDLLFEQFEINMVELKGKIKSALKNKTQISFTDFVKEFEIEKGVAEVVAYIEIAYKERNKHIVEENLHDTIDIRNTKTNKNFRVKVPQIIFCR